MAIINEIKCARCDRKYSSVRSRCPYCGARRIGRGKYSEDSDNAKGKMLISVLILAVFTVAAGILLFSTPADADAADNDNDAAITSPDDDIDSVLGLHPEPTPTPAPTPEPTPIAPLEVTSVIITYDGNPRTEFTAKIGEVVPLRVRFEPPILDGLDIDWSSSNEDVFQVVPVEIDRVGVNVTGIGEGTATLTVMVGDKEATCTVRITR